MDIRLKVITQAGKELTFDLKWPMVLPRVGETLMLSGRLVPVAVRDLRLEIDGVAWQYNSDTSDARPTVIATQKVY